MLEFISSGLGQPSPPPHALNGGNPLIIGAMRPIANAYIHGTQTKVHPWPEIEHIHRGSITQLRCSAGTKSLPWPQGTKSTSRALIRGNPLNQGAVSPIANSCIIGT
jgi:hypothetical protein